jgi:hypothetical protein
VYELACPNRENNEPVERYRFDTEGRKKGAEFEPDIYCFAASLSYSAMKWVNLEVPILSGTRSGSGEA